MATLVFTATDVIQISGTYETAKTAAGVTVTAGQICTKDTSGNVVLAVNTSWALSGQYNLYMALTGAAPGQSILLANPDSVVDYGATVEGILYYLSSTAGALEPAADLSSSDYLSVVAYGNSSDYLVFDPILTNTQVP